MTSTRPEINIHPNTYHISTLSKHNYDAIILGGGPTAQTAAVQLASIGKLSVLLVERELVGGECQNRACVPSKALLRPLEVVDDALSVGGTKQKVSTLGKPAVDVPGFWDYRDSATNVWNDEDNIVTLEKMGIKIVHGEGLLSGPKKVKITSWHTGDSVEVSADFVVVATGSEPVVPEVQGLTETGFWTPRDAVSSRIVPEHLIILGAGPVGSEFATVYARLGSRVTLVTPRARILPNIAAEAVERVQRSMDTMGVEVRINTRATQAQRNGKEVVVTFDNGHDVVGSEILLAVGRKTRTTGMGLMALGIREGVPVAVDEHMRASGIDEDWLYALGDTCGISNTTHMGMYEALIASQHIINQKGGRVARDTDRLLPHLKRSIPQTCFTEPQVSWVGLSVAQAKQEGIQAREVSVETGGPGTHSYLYAEEYNGFAQWVIEEQTGKIAGAVFVGKGVPNLLHASTVAVANELTWVQMLHAVPSFPTLSEAYNLLVQACLRAEWLR